MSISTDRRHDARVPIEMWVEESRPEAVYFQRTANLSLGGLYIENSVPHAVGTRMELRFTLPGEQVEIRATAEIVKIEQERLLGMHLKFVELPTHVTQRIDRYVGRQLGA